MKASEQDMVIHEVALSGGALVEEPFLSAVEGSFFVSRVGELVVLKPTAEGVKSLPTKVEQLVARGLHNVVLGFSGVNDLENDSLPALIQVKEVLDRCCGSLRMCDVSDGVRNKLATLGVSDGVTIVSDAAAAAADYQQSLAEEEPEDSDHESTMVLESSDLLESSTSSTEDPDDWGWGSGDDTEEPPEVRIAELLAEDAELPGLRKQIEKIVVRSDKRHVSLRLHFGRQVTSEDVGVLTSCRDYLASAGGQLVLVALQADVLKWLRLLEFDREFLIVEDADTAAAAHQKHVATLGRLEAELGSSRDGSPEPPTPSRVPDPVSSVEFESDVTLVPVGNGDSPALVEVLANARSETQRLQSEMSQLRSGLRQAEAGQVSAANSAKELAGAVRREERRAKEFEQAKQRAEQRAQQLESAHTSSRTEIRRLEGEVGKLRQETDTLRSRVSASATNSQTEIHHLQGEVGKLQQEADTLRSHASAGTGELQQQRDEISRLESQLGQHRQEADALRSEIAEGAKNAEELKRLRDEISGLGSQLTAATAESGGDGAMRVQLAGLEEEKARILTEAEQEIGRLTGEQALLREELQSAGEMIERLGKELELT